MQRAPGLSTRQPNKSPHTPTHARPSCIDLHRIDPHCVLCHRAPYFSPPRRRHSRPRRPQHPRHVGRSTRARSARRALDAPRPPAPEPKSAKCAMAAGRRAGRRAHGPCPPMHGARPSRSPRQRRIRLPPERFANSASAAVLSPFRLAVVTMIAFSVHCLHLASSPARTPRQLLNWVLIVCHRLLARARVTPGGAPSPQPSTDLRRPTANRLRAAPDRRTFASVVHATPRGRAEPPSTAAGHPAPGGAVGQVTCVCLSRIPPSPAVYRACLMHVLPRHLHFPG